MWWNRPPFSIYMQMTGKRLLTFWHHRSAYKFRSPYTVWDDNRPSIRKKKKKSLSDTLWKPAHLAIAHLNDQRYNSSLKYPLSTITTQLVRFSQGTLVESVHEILILSSTSNSDDTSLSNVTAFPHQLSPTHKASCRTCWTQLPFKELKFDATLCFDVSECVIVMLYIARKAVDRWSITVYHRELNGLKVQQCNSYKSISRLYKTNKWLY